MRDKEKAAIKDSIRNLTCKPNNLNPMLLAKFRYFIAISVVALIALTPAVAQKGQKRNAEQWYCKEL